jgi:hypothetical protein
MSTLNRISKGFFVIVLTLIYASCVESEVKQLQDRLNKIKGSNFISNAKNVSSVFVRSDDYYVFYKNSLVIVRDKEYFDVNLFKNNIEKDSFKEFIKTLRENHIVKFSKGFVEGNPVLVYKTFVNGELYKITYNVNQYFGGNYRIVIDDGDWFVLRAFDNKTSS